MKKIGLLNIGDSPIQGIDREKEAFLGSYEVIEKGILDGLTDEQVSKYLWQGEGPLLSVERNNGDFIKMEKKSIFPLIQEAINDLEHNGAKVVYIHCTSNFPEFNHEGILLEPGVLMKNLVSMMPQSPEVIILTPTESHRKQVEQKWKPLGLVPKIFALNPMAYTEKEVENICKESQNCKAMILDCASYNLELLEMIGSRYNGLVIQPLSLSLNVAKSLLN